MKDTYAFALFLGACLLMTLGCSGPRTASDGEGKASAADPAAMLEVAEQSRANSASGAGGAPMTPSATP